MSIFYFVKDHLSWVALVGVFLLFVSLSFGIGYLMGRDLSVPPIVIEKCLE